MSFDVSVSFSAYFREHLMESKKKWTRQKLSRVKRFYEVETLAFAACRECECCRKQNSKNKSMKTNMMFEAFMLKFRWTKRASHINAWHFPITKHIWFGTKLFSIHFPFNLLQLQHPDQNLPRNEKKINFYLANRTKYGQWESNQLRIYWSLTFSCINVLNTFCADFVRRTWHIASLFNKTIFCRNCFWNEDKCSNKLLQLVVEIHIENKISIWNLKLYFEKLRNFILLSISNFATGNTRITNILPTAD